MGKVTGFLEIDRQDRKYRPAADRIRNYREFVIPLPESNLRDQASRCMDCGIPFCHDVKGLKGCPVNNQISSMTQQPSQIEDKISGTISLKRA